jgi:hypothetical protein
MHPSDKLFALFADRLDFLHERWQPQGFIQSSANLKPNQTPKMVRELKHHEKKSVSQSPPFQHPQLTNPS